MSEPATDYTPNLTTTGGSMCPYCAAWTAVGLIHTCPVKQPQPKVDVVTALRAELKQAQEDRDRYHSMAAAMTLADDQTKLSAVRTVAERFLAAERERDQLRAELAVWQIAFNTHDPAVAVSIRTAQVERESLLMSQLEHLHEERDALAAALEQCHEGAARQLAEPRNHEDDQFALHAIATVCERSNYGDILGPRDARIRRETLEELYQKFSFDGTAILRRERMRR